MKTLVFEKHTKDVDGLLTELRREVGKDVLSVASDPKRTYVYVEDDSLLDPEPTVKQWEDVPELHVESTNRLDPEGIPVAWADGKDLHTIIIQKTTGYGDVIPDSTKIVLNTASKVPMSHRKLRLKEGLASVTIGPSETVGLISLSVVDTRNKMQPVAVRVRFVEPPEDEAPEVSEPSEPSEPSKPSEPVEPPAEPAESKATVWQRLRKMLGF